MKKDNIIIIADYSEQQPVSLDELCEMLAISPDYIQQLIEYDIVSPQGRQPEDWMFDVIHLQRAKTAVHLQRDLDVNLAGVALVLDLLEEMEELREKVKLLDRL